MASAHVRRATTAVTTAGFASATTVPRKLCDVGQFIRDLHQRLGSYGVDDRGAGR
jgi:hypothetical protein